MSRRTAALLGAFCVLALAISGCGLSSPRGRTFDIRRDGGYRIVLRAKLGTLSEAARNDWPLRNRSVTLRTLERRLIKAGYSGALVYRQGDDSFVVEMPKVANLKPVLAALTTTGRLEFRFAQNVRTDHDPGRPYVAVPVDLPDGSEEFDVRESGPGGKVLKTGSDALYRMISSDWDLIVDGSSIVWATAVAGDHRTGPYVELAFDKGGTRKLYDFSQMVEGRSEYLAIVLDRRIISFPIMKAVISDGKCVVEGGNMTAAKAEHLAALFSAGALPVALEVVSMTAVRP